MAFIEGSLTFRCCGEWVAAPHTAVVKTEIAQSGQLLAKWVCPSCGTIYTAGAIIESATTFVPIPEDILDAAGVDTEDFNEPDDPDVAMCVRCDGPVLKAIDFCPGCQEFVCDGCRTRIPRVGRFRTERHQADEHWQEPKFAEVATLSGDDDGSVLTGDDAIFTPEN